MATRAKILMVDDSPVVIEANRMVLEDAGYQVFATDNPLSVAAVMRRENPDLVLIDLNMPAVSGDVVTRIVTQHELVRRTPVVLYSDTPADELKRRADACGAAGFIRKTGDEEGFLSEVRRFLKK